MPVPYREPLFERLSARRELAIEVIYQAGAQRSWDQAEGWFPQDHRYRASHLDAREVRRPGRSPITWSKGLERALQRFAPDVVVVSEFGPATLRALAWCRARRRALVVLTEVTRDVERTLSAPQRLLHRRLARSVDGLIAVSTAAQSRLLALGVDKSRVTVSLQPIDEDALRAAAGGVARAGRVEVLTVARLVEDKAVDVLLQAFAKAGLASKQARLTVAGGGPLLPRLRQLAHELNVDARFLGALPASELPPLYAQADVFVLPSRYEPFGVALREAVVAGLPVICSSAVGAAADLADPGENAIIVAPDDIVGLAYALSSLCGEPERRAALADASKRLAAAHPLDVDVDAFAGAVSRAGQAACARRSSR